MVFDRDGNMFVTDRLNHRIRKIDADGIVSTFAGSDAGYQDGTGSNARFNSPIGMCIDGDDNLYVADFENYVIRKVTPGAEVTTYAGVAWRAGGEDGPRASAAFNSPHWVAISSVGDLFVADWLNGAVRRIGADGMVSTFAANLGFIEVTAVDRQGEVYASRPPHGGSHKFVTFDLAGRPEWSLGNEVGYQDGLVSVGSIRAFFPPLFLPDGNILKPMVPRIR